MLWRLRHKLVARGARFSAPDPHRKLPVHTNDPVAQRLGRMLRRRFSDRVENLFHEACLSGDVEMAEDLLAIMVKLHERRVRQFGQDHRIDDGALINARVALMSRRAMGQGDAA